ncbi:MAG: MinD/ParA family protein [Planctomycetota bacterium]
MTVQDQAQRLRELTASRPRGRVLSFTSGKGGVGKTNLSVAMALALTALKKRVALLDFDLGMANANVLLGCRHRWNLGHFARGEKSLVDTMVMGPGGLLFLPGANGLSELADMGFEQRETLLTGLESLEGKMDYIIVDTGAGISRNVLALAGSADDLVLVTTPEPTAILDAYGILKNLAVNPPKGTIHLLVNQVPGSQVAADVADRITSTASHFLDLEVGRLGYVLSDMQVPESVIRRRSFLIDNPRCAASRCVEVIARHINHSEAPPKPEGFFRRLMGRWGV